MARVVAIGEVMVELGLAGAGEGRLAFAGDTFNSAVYLQRLGVDMAYATVLGAEDPFTRGVLDLMREEGIDDRLVVRAPGRLPGLYAIERDAQGERRFFYWRGEAPVRDFATLVDRERLASAISDADLVYLSAITLAVVGPAGRNLLRELLAGVRYGLDLNYRARLWENVDAARAAVGEFAQAAAIVSASDEDLGALGLSADRWPGERILRGADHTLTLRSGAEEVRLPPPEPVRAVDTTGAGDSFNAGYLAARLHGADLEEAARAGRRLAATVVAHAGAIIPKAAMPT